MPPMISVSAVAKRYATGFVALDSVDLSVERGEIFALLGPNGAGKTSLIGVICGTISMTSGSVSIAGHDIQRDFRAARKAVGLVPQEIALDIFATVKATVSFSRRLFGRPADPAFVERLLRDLFLWEKRDSRVVELSGGMKRRVMIAKAVAHEPQVLFLDEPTAGVDVNLRRDLWALVRRLRDSGVTIVLTTHYIEEAEELADRVGVIDKGRILLVEDKATLMRKFGTRRLTLLLAAPMLTLPPSLAGWSLELEDEGRRLVYRFDHEAADARVPELLTKLSEMNVAWKDIETSSSSLEDIFVDIVARAA
jgi:ABC-2 type transport system ATP-binding protein